MVVLGRAVKTIPVLLWAVMLLHASAFDDPATELKVKSAFLYNFTKFVKWPAAEFSAPTDPFIICVSGSSDLEETLKDTLHDKKVDSHPLEVKRVRALDAKGCQVLFIPGHELTKLAPSLPGAIPPGVLTVSEGSDAKEGSIRVVMIAFVPDANRIRFAISNKTAEKANMEISSKLLSLAICVDQ